DDGGAARRAAADAGHRHGLGAAPAAGHRDGRRAPAEPAADAVHDAGDLPRVRPARPAPARRPRTRGRRQSARGRAGGRAAVSLSTPFVHRPVATTLLTLGVALAGAAAFPLLPVSPLPQVDFPTISVSAQLPGASPEVMAATVATPLERALGRIAGVTE